MNGMISFGAMKDHQFFFQNGNTDIFEFFIQCFAEEILPPDSMHLIMSVLTDIPTPAILLARATF